MLYEQYMYIWSILFGLFILSCNLQIIIPEKVQTDKAEDNQNLFVILIFLCTELTH